MVDMTTTRICECGHDIGQHELRGGGLLGCFIVGCGCIDHTPAVVSSDGPVPTALLPLEDGWTAGSMVSYGDDESRVYRVARGGYRVECFPGQVVELEDGSSCLKVYGGPR